MTDPLTFEEWINGRGWGRGMTTTLREAFAAGVASQQAIIDNLNLSLDEYGTKYATLNAVRHDLGLSPEADENAMRDRVQWLTYEGRRLGAQLAEKEAEIERLQHVLNVDNPRLARYEAVVEAARELVSPCKHERGFCVAHGTVRLPCSVAELRDALAALDKA